MRYTDVRAMMKRNRPASKPYPPVGDTRFSMSSAWFRANLRAKIQQAIHERNMIGMQVV